jgi:hypothetical protein
MTANVLHPGLEIFSLLGSAFVLFVFALALALPHRPKTLPGSSGHRDKADESIHEEIRPDGYIDDFAGEIEEAGGSVPWVVAIAVPAILLWWLIYLILFWTPR